MRLIDADALEKAIYEWMPKDQETWMNSDIPPIENLVVSIMMTIQEQPTVDAVPVIRCKDCKHWDGYYCHHKGYGNGYANYSPPIKSGEGFCDWAERKEE